MIADTRPDAVARYKKNTKENQPILNTFFGGTEVYTSLTLKSFSSLAKVDLVNTLSHIEYVLVGVSGPEFQDMHESPIT